jgi:enamine deaminase RidA (YjgF/YER057c/UK114 family)
MGRRRSALRLSVAGVVLAGVMAPPLAAQERFPDPPRPGSIYSDAVRVGNLVFLSGVVSLGKEPAVQFRGIFRRIGQILEQAGSSLEHVVDMTTYHVDMHDHIRDFIAAKEEFLPQDPSWTAVGVTELFTEGAVVEVKVIAAVSDASR